MTTLNLKQHPRVYLMPRLRTKWYHRIDWFKLAVWTGGIAFGVACLFGIIWLAAWLPLAVEEAIK